MSTDNQLNTRYIEMLAFACKGTLDCLKARTALLEKKDDKRSWASILTQWARSVFVPFSHLISFTLTDTPKHTKKHKFAPLARSRKPRVAPELVSASSILCAADSAFFLPYRFVA